MASKKLRLFSMFFYLVVSIMTVGSTSVLSSDDYTPTPDFSNVWYEPYRYVETAGEVALGRALAGFYLQSGMRIIHDERLSLAWKRLEPTIKKSFKRVDYSIQAYDRMDVEIIAFPGSICVSKGMIDALDDDELAAIICHKLVNTIDSARFKSLQSHIDSSGDSPLQRTSLVEIAAFLRGEGSYSEIWNFSLEQTSIAFTVLLCEEAGVQPKSLARAWGKMRQERTIDFEDYMSLHGLGTQLWPYTQALLRSLTMQKQSRTEVKSEGSWSLQSVSILEASGQTTEASLGSMNVIDSFMCKDGWNVGIDAITGCMAFEPKDKEYWTVIKPSGEMLASLDHRDNLFIEYSDLQIAPGADKVVLTTQQDIIEYDLKKNSSTWLGLGSYSELSGDGSLIAFCLGSTLAIKSMSDKRLVRSASLDIEGDVTDICWAYDNHRIAFIDSGKMTTIYTLDIVSGKSETIESPGSVLSISAWTDEGITAMVREGIDAAMHVVFTRSEEDDKWVIASKKASALKVAEVSAVDYRTIDGKLYMAAVVNPGQAGTSPELHIQEVMSGRLQRIPFPSGVAAVGVVKWLEPPGRLAVTVLARPTQR